MTVSREEAVALLRKWAEERRPVGCVSRVGPAIVAINGRAVFRDDAPNSVVVESWNGGQWYGGRLTLALDQFQAFLYQDVREAPADLANRESIISLLQLDSPEIRVCLYELAEPGEAER